MKLRSIAGWSVVLLVVLVSTAGRALAGENPGAPEDPTMVLVALGGAGMAWQYFRSRVRK